MSELAERTEQIFAPVALDIRFADVGIPAGSRVHVSSVGSEPHTGCATLPSLNRIYRERKDREKDIEKQQYKNIINDFIKKNKNAILLGLTRVAIGDILGDQKVSHNISCDVDGILIRICEDKWYQKNRLRSLNLTDTDKRKILLNNDNEISEILECKVTIKPYYDHCTINEFFITFLP